jgi:hypothetical protein
MSEPVTNIQVRKHALSTFVINQLVHIGQKKKITLEIADSVKLIISAQLQTNMINTANFFYLHMPTVLKIFVFS